MFLIRTILTVVLAAGIGGLLWMDHALKTDVGFMIVVFCAVVLSVQELYDLMRQKGYTPWSAWGTACAGLMVLADWLGYRDIHPELRWVGVAAFVFLCGLFILQGWFRPRPQGVISMALTAFGIVYVWGLAHFIVRLRYLLPEVVGIRGVLLLVAVVKAGDIAAYIVGSRWGRHRPFTQVSSQKSWEGYIGGTVASLAAGVFFGRLLLDNMTWGMALTFAVPVCLFGHLGDLVESVIKRDLDAKDSGIRFPGLGGVLDVVDSLLLAAPVAFYLLEQMVIMGRL